MSGFGVWSHAQNLSLSLAHGPMQSMRRARLLLEIQVRRLAWAQFHRRTAIEKLNVYILWDLGADAPERGADAALLLHALKLVIVVVSGVDRWVERQLGPGLRVRVLGSKDGSNLVSGFGVWGRAAHPRRGLRIRGSRSNDASEQGVRHTARYPDRLAQRVLENHFQKWTGAK